MQGFPNLWWQALLLVPLVMVAWLLVRLLRRQSRPGSAPQLFRFLVLSALVHVLILLALDLVHVTTQFAELHPGLMEEIVRTFSGDPPAESVQQPWERVPDLSAPEPPETAVAAELPQADHFTPELVGTPPTISAAQAKELSPERVLFVPPQVADAPSAALARTRPRGSAVEPELPVAEPPEPVLPSPVAAPGDAAVAMERRTTEAVGRDLTALPPDPLRQPSVPHKTPPRSSAGPDHARVEHATSPPRDRTLVSSPDVPLAETATPARVAKGDEPILADITVPLGKQPTAPMASPGPKLADMPVARTPIRPPTLAYAAVVDPRRRIEPPRLDAPAVAEADRLRGRVTTFDPTEPPPVSRVVGPAQESPLQEVALPVDRQPTSLIRLPQAGPNMAAISFPTTNPNQLAQTAVPRRDRVPDTRAAAAASVARAPVRIQSVSAPADLPGPRVSEKAAKLESSETAIVLARTTAYAPVPASPAALLQPPLGSVDAKAKPRRPDLVIGRVSPRDPELKSATTVLLKQSARGGPVSFVTDELAIKMSLTIRQENTRQQLVEAMGGNKETEAAVERGLAWLAAHQGPEGNWSLHKLYCQGHQCDGVGNAQSDTAATALALLPFLGAGHTHTRGKYIETVRRGVSWLVHHQKPDGDLSVQGGQVQMYSHALATIALCELCGMTGDPVLRGPTGKALRFIVDAQDTNSGGWRYNPRAGGDTSVVGWQLMALKSGEMAQFHVPSEVYERAARWLDSVSRGPRRELYGYQPGSGPTPPMTAEAVLSRQFLGWQRHHESMIGSADYLRANLPKGGARNFYYWYYATQAMFHMQGEYWPAWNSAMTESLLSSQVKDGPAAGSWHPSAPSPDTYGAQGGRIYVTGLALLMLEVYYRHLPLYQQLNVLESRQLQ